MKTLTALSENWFAWQSFRRYRRASAAYRERQRAARPADAVSINFPQADEDFDPPLFQVTINKPNRSEMDILAIQAMYLTLYRTTRVLGYRVNQCSNADADLVVNWAETRAMGEGPPERKLYMELGWLPRTSFQISPDGVNTRSHVASSFTGAPLMPEQRERVLRYLERMRLSFARGVSAERVARIRESAGGEFILFAFQLANDFNLRYSASIFQDYYSREEDGTVRFAQACVDHMDATATPLPVIFKQHPSDRSDLTHALKLTKPRNRLWPNALGYSTHDIFASGLCRLVVSVNSNTVHEAACWGIPGVCLGNLLWTEQAPLRPYTRTLDALDRAMATPVREDPTLLSYLFHVLKNQWTLADFQNPFIVEKLFETKGRCVPYELREQIGFHL